MIGGLISTRLLKDTTAFSFTAQSGLELLTGAISPWASGQ
jgi:hypothetical protein